MAAKPIYAAGLDAGSRRTRLVICVLENSRIRFAGASSVESQGWTKGRIADQQAVADTVTAALREADSSAAYALQSVVVGMGGPSVRGANGRGVLELGYVQEIQHSDIRRVIERASRVQLMEDRMVLQLFPQDFVVDDHPGHRDPRKMLASRLEINVHLVTSSIQEHNAIIGAVNAARVIGRETIVGLLNGLMFALIMGVIAFYWFGSGQLGVVIGAAMIINLLVAALSGILIPLGLHALDLDPAIASGVFVTMMTDCVGFFAFLGLAALWLT